jgi:hypothetical protein
VELVLLREQVVVAKLGTRRGIDQQLHAAHRPAAPLADRQVERVVGPGGEVRGTRARRSRNSTGRQHPACLRIERAAIAWIQQLALLQRGGSILRAVVVPAADSDDCQYHVQKYVITYATCR